MKTKWVVAIALAMWATGVVSHVALLAVIPQETAQQQECTRPQNSAPAPAMSAMCVPATKGAPPPATNDEFFELSAEIEAKFAEIKKDDEEIAQLIKRLNAIE